MSTFKLTIQYPTRDGYPVVAEHCQAERFAVRTEGRLQLDAELLLELRACDDMAEYGRTLGQALFVGAILHALLRARAISGDRMHVLLCVEATELRTLHWERLQAPLDDGQWDFLSLDQRAPLSLYTPSSTDRRFLAFGPHELRVLFLIACPSNLADYGLPTFSAGDVLRRIQRGLGQLPYAVLGPRCRPGTWLGPPTLAALCEALTTQRFTLLHILCHGQQRADGETILYWEDEDGTVLPLPATQLLSRLGRIRGAYGLPHLGFLASCESGKPDAEAALGGLGQRMVRELGLPAVIAMTQRVAIDLAMDLSERFFSRLQVHGFADVALVEASTGLAEHRDVLVPALYTRLGDRPLWIDDSDGLGTAALSANEVERGLCRLEALLCERAPVLLTELASAAGDLRDCMIEGATSQTKIWRCPPPPAALRVLDELSSEAVERSFVPIAREQPLAPYDSRCPFPGLNSFSGQDRSFFFGREKLVQRMVQRVIEGRFLAVLGPSGSGKSSVVAAGLVPALQQLHPDLQVMTLTPGCEPLHRLQRTLQRVPSPSAASQSAATPLAALCVVQQFEETFTQCRDRQQRQQFIDALLMLPPHCAVVLTLRADFWGECAEHEALKEAMLARQELVGPLTGAELRSSMEQQVAAVGLRFQDGLCAQMLADLQEEAGAMPLLQHALLELWKRRRGAWLRTQEYLNFGGVQMAIAETAEAVYLQSADHPDEQQRMRDIFIRLTHLEGAVDSPESVRTCRRCTLFSELVPVDSARDWTKQVIHRLADARLIVTRSHAESGELEVEVAHEAVVRYWPRLRCWLEEERLAISLREGVRQAASEWRAGGCAEHLLLHRGERLRLVLEKVRSHSYPLNQREHEYVMACQAAQQAAKRREEEQRKRELRSAQELAAALERAVTAARVAQSRQLAMHAASLRDSEPLLALLLAREAAQRFPTAEALSQLQRTLCGSLEYAILRGHRDALVCCLVNPSGTRLLTTSVDGTARLWNLESPEDSILCPHDDAVLAAAWSHSGDRFLTASSDHSARIWDRRGSLLARLTGHQGPVLFGSFSRDDQRLLTCSADHTARIWDRQGAQLGILKGHSDVVYAACFRPDGQQILTVSRDRQACLWSPRAELQHVLGGHQAAVSHGCYSPDGSQILTISRDGTGRLWTPQGVLIAVLRGHQDRVNEGLYSPDGQHILTVSRDHTARLWDRSGSEVAVLSGHEKGVQSACFSPDGRYILTCSSDHTARLWDRQGRSVSVLRGHEKAVQSGCFIRGGSGIATASWDGSIRLWPGSGSCLMTLQGHQGSLTGCAVRGDGQAVMTCAEDGTARLYRSSGELIAVLDGHSDVVTSAQFSKDGSTILTTSRDHSASLWSGQGIRLRTLHGHRDWVIAGAFSAAGDCLVTASIDGTARLWSLGSDADNQVLSVDAPLTSCQFSADGALVATAVTDGGVVLWSSRGQLLRRLCWHQESVSSVAFAPSGPLILTTSWDASACLFSVTSAQPVRLSGHQGPLLAGCFNRDGSRILTTSRDRTARIWSAQGDLLAVLRGHRDWVIGGCFAHGSNAVLTVSRDGEARLWHGDGRLWMVLQGHRDALTAGCFSPDDQYVLTASADQRALRWPAQPTLLYAAAERHALRALSQQERGVYLDFDSF